MLSETSTTRQLLNIPYMKSNRTEKSMVEWLKLQKGKIIIIINKDQKWWLLIELKSFKGGGMTLC